MASSTEAKPLLVIAVWDDAWADSSDFCTPKDVHMKHKATVMETIGWLLGDDKEGVSIFNERCLDDGQEQYRGRTFIPRPLIRSVTPFKLASIRKPRYAKTPPPSPPSA